MSERFGSDRAVAVVMAQLVTLVLDQRRTPTEAAAMLRDHTKGPALRRALARVRLRGRDPLTPVDARAVAILEAALADIGAEPGEPVARDFTQSGPPAPRAAVVEPAGWVR